MEKKSTFVKGALILILMVLIGVVVFIRLPITEAMMMNKLDRYDSLFEYHAEYSPLDWKFVKALAIEESHLNPLAVSPAGAKGIMQLMENTALDYSLGRESIFDLEKNIRTGIAYLEHLYDLFCGERPQIERLKFTVASYNSGIGYIDKAMDLCKIDDKSTELWKTVEPYLADGRCVVYGKRPDTKQIKSHVEKVMRRYEEMI